jgi:hypothetical protein
MRASGSRPSRPSAGSSVNNMAAAPSLSGEALPAVTDPSGRKLGRRRRNASSEVSARMLSSRSRSRRSSLSVTKLTSSSNRPASQAAAARWCDRRANASCASRPIA